MKEVVIASNNEGKIIEFKNLLKDLPIKITTQADYNLESVPETGLTFIENAIIKARHVCARTGLPAIADDSGLEVDVLKGAPGIYSARYAGEKSNATDNVQKLLNNLKNIENRRGNFYCALVYMRHETDPAPIIAEAAWHGEILTQPNGDGGFGYDPVFYVPEENCSAAELDQKTKNKLSHRGKAMQILLEKIKKELR